MELQQNHEAKKKIGYKDLLSETNFLKIAIGTIISRFGDAIDVVAYGWLVFQMTGSVALLAVLYAVNGIPSFFFSMISGVLVTHMDKKKVVYICDFGRGATVLLTAGLFLTGHLEIWHLFVFTFMNSTFEAFRTPAATPLFMRCISEEKRNVGIAANSSGSSFAEFVGYGVAGILIGAFGSGVVIMIDAITFLITGLLVFSIKIEKENLQKVKLTFGGYLKDFKDGFNYVRTSRLIFSVCLFAGIFNFFVVPFNALQPAYVDIILNKGSETISVMALSFLLAMSLTSLLTPKLKEHVAGKFIFVAGGFLIGISYLAFSQLGAINDTIFLYPILVLCCVMMGAGTAMISLIIKMAIMGKIEPQYLARSIAFINALGLSVTPLGGALVGFLVSFMSIKVVYMIFSVALIIVFIQQALSKTMKSI